MATLSGIRTKLDTKVFNKIGTTADLKTYTQTVDKWGDATKVYGTATSVKCVPYDYIVGRLNYQPFGDLSEEDSIFVVRYDTVVETKYVLTFKSQDYEVKQVEEYLYEGSVLAKLVRVSKIL